MHTADVAVIGAGIVGASCAWYLAARGFKVVVLERERTYAQGTTGKSVAGVRVQFSGESNVRLSALSLPVFREMEDRYGLDVGYVASGYMLLVPELHWDAHMDSVAMQRRVGVPVEVLDIETMCDVVPMNPAGLAGATLGPIDGRVDPCLTTVTFVTLAEALRAWFVYDAPLRAIERGVSWRVTAGDETYDVGAVVNAAGCWSAEVAKLAGLDLPVRPVCKQIFMSEPTGVTRAWPFAIDVGTGFFLRPEGDRLLFGQGAEDDPVTFDGSLDEARLRGARLVGERRYPWLAEHGTDLDESWWGLYAVTPDHNPIIGAHPHADGWVDATGFSGHGVMHAPATGLLVAELIADGAASTMSLEDYRHDRFDGERGGDANIF